MAVITVNGLDQEVCLRDIDSGVCALLHFCDFEKGLLHVVKDQLLVIASLQPDGLPRLISNDPGVRHGFLRDFIAVRGDGSKNRLAVGPGGHVGVIPIMDTTDFKVGVGDHVPGLGVPFQNREVRELFVRCRD